MKILLILLAMVSTVGYAHAELVLPILYVYDGDTIPTSMPLPGKLARVSVRINRIDTPELPAASYAKTGKLNRAKCHREAELALEAKQGLIDLIGTAQKMTVRNFKWGRNGGRIVGDVYIGNVDVASYMVANGYAVQYDGTGKRENWCKKQKF